MLKVLNSYCKIHNFTFLLPHQWRSGSALKTGRRQVPGSIPGCACRPSRSKFSVVFFETRVNTGQDPLERLPQRTLPLQGQVPQADNWPYPYNQPTFTFLFSYDFNVSYVHYNIKVPVRVPYQISGFQIPVSFQQCIRKFQYGTKSK